MVMVVTLTGRFCVAWYLSHTQDAQPLAVALALTKGLPNPIAASTPSSRIRIRLLHIVPRPALARSLISTLGHDGVASAVARLASPIVRPG